MGIAKSIVGRLDWLGGSARLTTGADVGTEWELTVSRDGRPAMTDADPGFTVMVVDDHPIWRDAVARDLEEDGFRVVATADGVGVGRPAGRRRQAGRRRDGHAVVATAPAFRRRPRCWRCRRPRES